MKKICVDCGGDVFHKYGSTEMRDSNGVYTHRCWKCMRLRVVRMIDENRRAYGFQIKSSYP